MADITGYVKPKLSDRIVAVVTPTRLKIYLLAKKKPRNIRQLQEELNMTYPATWKQIKILEEAHLVELKNIITKKGKEVIVKAIIPGNLLQRVINQLKKEYKL